RKVHFAAGREDADNAGFGDGYIAREIVKPVAERNLEMEQGMRDEALEAFSIWDKMADKTEY
ncbi:MAG: nucleoside deaminase, partial [Desulfobulbaceae bacterium]|nr:nucleoside deaminase [Desulfobulbaceae bacterium]